MNAKTLSRGVLAVAILGGIGAAHAQSLEVSNTTAAAGTNDHLVTVTFTNSNPITVSGYEFTIPFDDTKLDISATDFVFSGTTNAACNVLASPARMKCLVIPNGLDQHLPATDEIKVKVDIKASAPAGDVPLDIDSYEYSDDVGNALNGTVTNGKITITAAGADDADAAFNPASGATVEFNGATGSSVNGAVAVNVSGSTGNAVISDCNITGADAAHFSLTTAIPLTIAAGGNGSLALNADIGAVDRKAALECKLNDSNSANEVVSWPLLSKPGTSSNPAYSSAPVPGATISASGAAATTANQTVAITNTGANGLDYNCTVSGTGFSIVSGGSATGLAANASSNVVVQFTFPAAGSTENGSLECTHNGGNIVSPVSYALQATGQGPGPGPGPNPPGAAPHLVPASSLWSQIAMFGLFGALGMLVLGLRRGR